MTARASDKKTTVARILKSLVVVCAEDAEFGRRARFMEGNVRFGIDDEGWILRFFDGRLVEIIDEAAAPAIGWDYELVGPYLDWERMWEGELDFPRAVVPGFGSIRIRGNRTKYAGDVTAIAQICQLLLQAAHRAFGTSVPGKPASPTNSADPWLTRNEIIGRYVNVDGTRIYYETIGQNHTGLDFLAFHSAGRDCRQWQQLGDLLAPLGRFVSFDLPGHFKSWPLPGNKCLSTMDELARFAWRFRAAIGMSRPTVLLGDSIGGNIVYQLAGDYQNEVAAIVSMQGVDYSPTQPASTRVFLDHPGINPGHNNFDRSSSLIGRRAPSAVREFIEWGTRSYSSPTLLADLTAYSDFDYRSRMSNIRCPCLLIRGRDDWVVSDEMVDATAERLVNARALEVIKPEGVGHFPHCEQPIEVADAITTFLKQNGLIQDE